MQISPKVGGAAIAGAIVTIGVWALGTYAHVTLPPDVTAAATVIVGAVTGYLIPHSSAAPPQGTPQP
jgi:hypothetical protein